MQLQQHNFFTNKTQQKPWHANRPTIVQTFQKPIPFLGNITIDNLFSVHLQLTQFLKQQLSLQNNRFSDIALSNITKFKHKNFLVNVQI